jgi:hypothetical protein
VRRRQDQVPGPARARRATRAHAIAGLLASTAVPALVLRLLTPSTLAAARADRADVSALLGAAALAIGWLVVLRLALMTLAVVAAAIPGTVGAIARRLAEAITPRLLRSAVRVGCGVVIVGAPLASTGALADPGTGPPAVRSSTVRLVDPADLPVLDRGVVGPVPEPVHPRPPSRPGRVVVVRSGDTLWSIAARDLGPGHSDGDVARAWPAWYRANADRVGPDPSVIRPGERLRAPAPRVAPS